VSSKPFIADWLKLVTHKLVKRGFNGVHFKLYPTVYAEKYYNILLECAIFGLIALAWQDKFENKLWYCDDNEIVEPSIHLSTPIASQL